MAEVVIPRGIQEIVKKEGRKKVIKYRIRITKKTLEFNRYYDNLEEAITDLDISKKPNAKEIFALKYRDKQEEAIFKNALSNFYDVNYANPSLKYYIAEYTKEHLDYKDGEHHNRKRLKQNQRSFFATISKTEVIDPSIEYKAGITSFQEVKKRKPFGDIPPLEITQETIDDYCRQRRKSNIKAISIARELNILSIIFKWLNRQTEFKGKIPNFALTADRDTIKLWKREDKRSKAPVYSLKEDEWKDFFLALDTAENPDLKRIVMLSIATAMRRSECIDLHWEQVDLEKRRISLHNTKNGESREVFMNDNAYNIFIDMKPEGKTGKVFSYKNYGGFHTTYCRIIRKHNIKINFHRMRKEAITNMLIASGISSGEGSPSMMARFLGIKNVINFNKKYVRPLEQVDISTEKGILKNNGHSDPQVMFDHYFLEEPKKDI